MNALKLLAVFAHPDDESMGMGGTLAKYAAGGVETHLVCASRGERGWSGPEEQFPGLEGLGGIRTKELEEAVTILGMRSLSFLGYIDGDVDQANPGEAIGRIVTHIRRIQPQVVVTFGHDGIYGHPDHVAIGQFTTAAIVCAADSSYADPENLPAHCVSKLYYMVDSEEFVNLVMPYFEDMSFPVDDQIRSENPWKEWMISARVELAVEHCRAALRAIKCHASQKASLGGLADLDEEMVLPILAKQGTFYRAFSLVNGGRKMESDLFEGLR
jgi:LmbE family N-acetylglucosaminyl deacetylase